MIVVLADDLSGAAELAGVAVRHGLTAEVQTAFSSDSNAHVLCVATDTRSMRAVQAATAVTAFTKDILAAGPSWIFKKCDSVLRGPVLAEAKAMARAANKPRCVILSANPSRGRVIRNGIYLVNEQPLHETLFARDPEHPCSTSRVADLLGGSLSGIETPDADSVEDVVRHAATVDAMTLPVGAADFFEALLKLRAPHPSAMPENEPHDVGPIHPAPGVGNALLVCGSAASWNQRRTEAQALGLPVFSLPHDREAVVRAAEKEHRVLIGIGEGPSTRGLAPLTLAEQLAQTIAEIVRATAVSHLLLEGGATTAAVMRAVGWTRLRACDNSAEGVGVLLPASSSGPLLYVKPGSYPWPPSIWPRAVLFSQHDHLKATEAKARC